MRNCFALLLALFFAACANVSKRIDMIHPNEYGISEEFDGKMFSISCYGNGYADGKYVDDMCKGYMAEFANSRGYKLFSVLDQDASSHVSVGAYTINQPVTTYSNAVVYGGGYSAYGYGSSTTYVPKLYNYTVTMHSKAYVFVLISENEKDEWQNYYKVSDYYNPVES